MNVTFVKCESFGCKNLTSDLYIKLFGAYCFEHTSKVNKPVGVLEKPKSISPISPRRTVLAGSPSRSSGLSPKSTTLSPEITFENYEYKPRTVVSPVRTPMSPRKSAYIPQTECCICKDLYDENKIMKCGHLICPQCLEGRVRSPFCDFCGEPLDGPFVTPEVLLNIEDKYKQDKESEEYEEESEEESDSEEEYEYFSPEREPEIEESGEVEKEEDFEEDYIEKENEQETNNF